MGLGGVGSNPMCHTNKKKNMEVIKLFLTLIGSVLLQIILSPLRLIVFVLNFLEKLFKILKLSFKYLIVQITEEVIKKE